MMIAPDDDDYARSPRKALEPDQVLTVQINAGKWNLCPALQNSFLFLIMNRRRFARQKWRSDDGEQVLASCHELRSHQKHSTHELSAPVLHGHLQWYGIRIFR